MKSKERVLLSLNHDEPDWVPLFGPNVIETREPYDTRVMEFLDTFAFDRFAKLGGLISTPRELRAQAGDTFVDGYGCRYKYMGVGRPYCTHSPLANAETVAEIEAFNWPDPEAPGLLAENARERAKAVRDQQEHVVTVGVSTLFHQYHFLRGFEQWMIDIKLNRGVHEAIAAHIHHINSTLAMRLMEEVGEYVDIVTTGDDLGTSIASYMSPADFRALLKPYYSDLIGRIKARFPHIKFYLHSHGQIMDLVPDLIECGVDVLNPILPLDHMDPVRLEREFGRDLCFHGGIDVEHILPFGSVDQVRDHVKEVIDILAPGGGYWFTLQAISPVIPPENVIAAYEVALEYGRYHR